MEFLGHHIDKDGIRPLPDKVEAILKIPVPTSLKKLRQFLGLVNFYRRFIPSCTETLFPLTDLLRDRKKKNENLSLSTTEIQAFQDIKQTYT